MRNLDFLLRFKIISIINFVTHRIHVDGVYLQTGNEIILDFPAEGYGIKALSIDPNPTSY